MRLTFEVGHGYGYLQQRELDMGLLTEEGEQEPELCKDYARRMKHEASLRKPVSRGTVEFSGKPYNRLRAALKRKTQAILSLHLGTTGKGRVRWYTEGSEPLALKLGEILGVPVQYVNSRDNPVLEFEPSVEIEIANITDPEQMRQFKSGRYAAEYAAKVLTACEAALETVRKEDLEMAERKRAKLEGYRLAQKQRREERKGDEPPLAA